MVLYFCAECGFVAETPGVCEKCKTQQLKPSLNGKEAGILNAGYYLRDDTELRKEWDDVIRGETPAEAYSLCKKSDDKYPFQRVEIFAGPREWAIDKAFDRINEGVTLTTWDQVKR